MIEAAPPLRVAIIGGGRASEEELRLAEALGKAIGKAGGVVITGGLGGVMEAASRGCYETGAIVIGVLPGRDPSAANRWVTFPLPTGMGEARNALVVRAGEAVVSVGGGWGTLSEIALARKMGIPVAVLGRPPSDLELPRPEGPEAAAAWALANAKESRRDWGRR
jgi:uncharacterized protein (TIGR00725 family)